MNNIDIHDIQLWAVALVGSFYNNLRKVPAHKRTTSVFKNVNNLEPLHLYVTEIPQSEVVKIILNAVSQDNVGEIAVKKQIVVNTLGEYEAAALACGEYLNRPSLQAATNEDYIAAANGSNSSIYAKNSEILSDFARNFKKNLEENMQSIIDALASLENQNSATYQNPREKHGKL